MTHTSSSSIHAPAQAVPDQGHAARRRLGVLALALAAAAVLLGRAGVGTAALGIASLSLALSVPAALLFGRLLDRAGPR